MVDMSSEVAKRRPMPTPMQMGMMKSASYRQRPRSASSRSSFDLSPLPENVDLTGDYGQPSVSKSFDSEAIDEENRSHSSRRRSRKRDGDVEKRARLSGQGRRQQSQSQPPRMEKQKSESFLSGLAAQSTRRPNTAPLTVTSQSPHLRSARYLATQWRSRATQWSASSSMRNFKESSSLPSSPPPPLTEHDSDSDTGSLDESIASHVSDAHNMIEAWKNRVDSMSVGTHDDDDDESDDGIQSMETLKISNSSEADEYFGESFAFARHTASQVQLQLQSQPQANETQQSSPKHEMDEITNNFANPPNGKGKGNMPQMQKDNAKVSRMPSDVSDSSPRTVITPKASGRKNVVPASKSESLKSSSFPSKTLAPKPETRAFPTKTSSAKTPTRPIQNSVETKKEITSTSTSAAIRTTPKRPSSGGETTTARETATAAARLSPTHSCFSSTTAGTAITAITAMSMNRPASEPTRWEEYEVVFSFSLLTNRAKAPPTGPYLPEEECTSFKDKLHNKSPLLHSVLEKFSSTLRQVRSLTNEKGKYMMCPPDCTPVTRFVQRDATFVPSGARKDTVRSLVRLSVPIFVPRGDRKARDAASLVVKRTFAKAISSGEFSGFS